MNIDGGAAGAQPWSREGKLGLLRGPVPPKAGLTIWSKMRNGMVYIDGAHVRYRFDFGDEIRVVPEAQPLLVYGVGKRRK